MWQLLLLTLTLTLTLARALSDQVCRAWQRLPCPETHEAIEWLRARVRSRVRDRVRVRVRDWVRDSVRDIESRLGFGSRRHRVRVDSPIPIDPSP